MIRGVGFWVPLGLLALSFFPPAAPLPPTSTEGLYPDLQTVVPKHLALQNKQQREILRFSNGIANVGEGDWRMRPDPPPGTSTDVTNAVQEILDANGNVVHEEVVSTFAYHPAHNHWHIGDVALFEVRPALDAGAGGLWGPPLVNDRGVAQSIKTTFCLIDWYKLDDNAPTSERRYFDCFASYQGIQPGWVDQYHQATEGQQVDVTGAAAGIYYLVSVANPDGTFLESDPDNNMAWASFALSFDSKGNPHLEELSHSPCTGDGMCGGQGTNR